MKYLLDSTLIAAAVKGRLPVVLRLSQMKPGEVAVSVLGQLEAEAALRRQPRLAARFGKLLRAFLESVPVLEVDAAVAQQAVHVGAQLGAGEEVLSGFDLLTAATALAHRLTLVTERQQLFAAVPGLDVEVWR